MWGSPLSTETFIGLLIAISYSHNSLLTHSIREGQGNPVDTGRKLNVHKTFNLRPLSTWNQACSESILLNQIKSALLTFFTNVTMPLGKICEILGFRCLVFSLVTTGSYILSMHGKILVSENPYPCIFYAVCI